MLREVERHLSLDHFEQPLWPCFMPGSQQLWQPSAFFGKLCEQDVRVVCKLQLTGWLMTDVGGTKR